MSGYQNVIINNTFSGLRRVALTKLVQERQENGSYKWIDSPAGEGWLHCWGSEADSGENGQISITVAIVEMEDGTVRTWLPERIRFLEPTQ